MRAVTALVTAFAVLLAGCLGSEPEAPAASEPAPDPNTVVLTAPDDYSYLENGSMGKGERWHIHDYWGGKDRLLIMEEESGMAMTCGGCDSPEGVEFRPPSKSVIPQGAAQVVVTFTWTEEGGKHGQPVLMFHAANEKEMKVAGPVESGVPFTLNSTNEMNDPPHQVLSLWEFEIGFPPVDGEIEFDGTVQIRVEAVRGLEIPPYPPHPDFWQGATEIELVSETNGPMIQREEERSTYCTMSCTRTHAPVDGIVVPYDATEVVVTIKYEPGMPVGLGLKYHGADTWDLAPAEGEMSPGLHTYRIPVTPETGDSPYAKQSLWAFRVILDEPTPIRVYAGSYTLSAKAVKA